MLLLLSKVLQKYTNKFIKENPKQKDCADLNSLNFVVL